MTENKDNPKFQLAFKLHQDNKLDEAEKLYMEILKENSNNAETLNLYGILKLQKNLPDEAEPMILKAVSIQPNEYFYENLAQVYLAKKEYSKAINSYEKAVKLNPQSPELLFGLALTYKKIRNFEEAIKIYNKVLEINPNFPQVYYNLAVIYTETGDLNKTISCYQKVIELSPNDLEAKYFLGLAYMQQKNYKEGLKYYENRLCRFSSIETLKKTYPNLSKQAKLWMGEDIHDKTIYTYFEAGFGDVIMFSRYLPLLKKKCKKLIFKPQRPLYQLFNENKLGCDEVLDLFPDEKDFTFDYHIPILSIPYILGLKEPEVFIFNKKYIKANPKKAEAYKTKYFNNNKFKIGIKWQGATFQDTDRIIQIENFEKIIALPDVQVYSCQTDDGKEDLNRLHNKQAVIDLGGTFQNFSDTAAALENMDLIICNDTSLAHLAGSMGKPCFILLPYNYNWRWHTDLTKSEWYQSVKLFRQKTPGDWTTVFEEVLSMLKSM